MCRVPGGAEQGWPHQGALVLSSSGAERGPAKAVLGQRGGKGALLSVLIQLRVPNGLEERERLTPGRKAPLLCSTQ